MKSSFFTIIFLGVIFSCKEKTLSSKINICGVNDPVRNLPWLRDLVEEEKKKDREEQLSVSIVKIGTDTVINYTMIFMSCIGCVSYHCDGTRVDFSKYTEQEKLDYQARLFGEKQDKVVIWPEK